MIVEKVVVKAVGIAGKYMIKKFIEHLKNEEKMLSFGLDLEDAKEFLHDSWRNEKPYNYNGSAHIIERMKQTELKFMENRNSLLLAEIRKFQKIDFAKIPTIDDFGKLTAKADALLNSLNLFVENVFLSAEFKFNTKIGKINYASSLNEEQKKSSKR